MTRAKNQHPVRAEMRDTVIQPYPTSPRALFASLWGNRELILQLTSREVLSRYRGSILGLAWSFFNPLLMLAVYTFVFSVVFKAQWRVGGEESKTDFAIVLFVGLIIHGLFAECLNRAPGLILSNVNYVKKVVFPLEILPWVAAGSALFHFTVSLAVLLSAQLVLQHVPAWTIVFLPVVLAPLVLATIGLAWFLSSIGVYVRDIGQIIGIFTTVLLFLSPVFYPVDALPENYRILLLFNPLTYVIGDARRVLIWGQAPDWAGLMVYACASFVVAWLGFWWFQKTRRGFADVV
jgi:lipopolysaccharide transport system permease protein